MHVIVLKPKIKDLVQNVSRLISGQVEEQQQSEILETSRYTIEGIESIWNIGVGHPQSRELILSVNLYGIWNIMN